MYRFSGFIIALAGSAGLLLLADLDPGNPQVSAMAAVAWLRLIDMVKTGLWLNLAAWLVITLVVYLFMPLVFRVQA